MRHCCKFDAFDIWYLKESDEFSDRTLFIGDCPICHKHVIELIQRNKKTNTYVTMKKVGESSLKFTKDLIKEILYSRNTVNKMKFKPKPYGWVYGLNKEKTDKNGNRISEQYSADFYGNTELVKRDKNNEG